MFHLLDDDDDNTLFINNISQVVMINTLFMITLTLFPLPFNCILQLSNLVKNNYIIIIIISKNITDHTSVQRLNDYDSGDKQEQQMTSRITDYSVPHPTRVLRQLYPPKSFTFYTVSCVPEAKL